MTQNYHMPTKPERTELHPSCKYQEFTKDKTIIFSGAVPQLPSGVILLVRERLLPQKLKDQVMAQIKTLSQ